MTTIDDTDEGVLYLDESNNVMHDPSLLAYWVSNVTSTNIKLFSYTIELTNGISATLAITLTYLYDKANVDESNSPIYPAFITGYPISSRCSLIPWSYIGADEGDDIQIVSLGFDS